MSTVILSMQVSLDGRIAGPDGEFDWPIVGDELLDLFNDQIANAETFLYGRRMYQEMAEFWPTGDSNPVATPAMADYARLWRPMPKIVFSDTLQQADWNTRIVGSDDLAATVAELRSQDRGRHILYGGAQLAGALMARDLIDEYWLFIHPVILGDGPRLFADLEHRLTLEQVETRTFPGSVVHVRYRCAH
ncbi:MAG: dihydrofolate reductase family protein [Nakamurella sp.]